MVGLVRAIRRGSLSRAMAGTWAGYDDETDPEA